METIWICVYRDTIEEFDDNCNLTEVQVTKEFAKQYFKDCGKSEYFKDFEEFYEEYTADDTEDFWAYATEHNAVIAKENW